MRGRAPLVAATIAVAALASAGCVSSSLVPRERVFDRHVFADVDALTLALLPRQVRDCGVQSEPRDLLFDVDPRDLKIYPRPRVWPAVDCISTALTARQPFVVRYRGMTMDSGTETVFVGRADGIFRIYQDRIGPFTLERCARDAVHVTSAGGVTCPRWLLVFDLRKEQLPTRWPPYLELGTH